MVNVRCRIVAGHDRVQRNRAVIADATAHAIQPVADATTADCGKACVVHCAVDRERATARRWVDLPRRQMRTGPDM